jgi:acetyl-CoA C-acetyltransferase
MDPPMDGLPDVYIAMGRPPRTWPSYRASAARSRTSSPPFRQNRAEAAQKSGFWARRDHPVTLPDGTVVEPTTASAPARLPRARAGLKPVFRPDGTVTAGNACPLNDGAAAVVVMSDTKAKELGLTPLARIVSSGVSGLNPEIMGLGPVEASRRRSAAPA